MPLEQSSTASQYPTLEEIYSKPWKYRGYKIFSKFVASDNDFFVIRRFGTLNARVILAMQDRISELEEQLDALDEQYSVLSCEDLNNGSFRDEPKQDRMDIINQLKPALLEYSTYNV